MELDNSQQDQGISALNLSNEEEEEEEEEEDQVYLSVVYQGQKIGLSCYDSSDCSLYVTEEYEYEDFGSLQFIKFQLSYPNRRFTLITCPHSNEKFMSAVKQPISESNSTFVDPSTPGNNNSNNTSSSSMPSTPRPTSESSATTSRSSSFDLQIEPATLFTFDSFKNKLNLVSFPPHLFPGSGSASSSTAPHPTSVLSTLSSILDFSNKQLIRSLSGLFSFLLKIQSSSSSTTTASSSANSFKIQISSIESLQMNGIMKLSLDSLKALHIFSSDKHPSAFTVHSKESLSIYSLLATHVQSPLAKKLLKQWLLRPLLDYKQIEARQNGIEYFKSQLEQGDSLITEIGDIWFKKIKDINKIIYTKLTLGCQEWQDYYNYFISSVSILRICEILHLKNDPKFLNFFNSAQNLENERGEEKQIISEGEEAVYEAVKILTEAIDVEETQKKKKIIFNKEVSKRLDELNEIFENLEVVLDAIAKEVVENLDMSYNINYLSIVYYPQVGYQAVIPKETKAKTKTEQGNEEEEKENKEQEEEEQEEDWDEEINREIRERMERMCNWRLSFETDKFFYFKTEFTDQLDGDEDLGDIWDKITEIENQIKLVLNQALIQLHNQKIKPLVSIITTLEVLYAFALIAIDQNWTKPEFVNENLIEITNGRHPLHELCVDNFISNSTSLNPRNKMVQIITGSNGSGKSVYMKQIGVIVYMAQIGSFVSAERTVMGIVDAMFTRIRGTETASDNMSLFAMDLNQIQHMIQMCSIRSLLLIDEFGKGTDLFDGVSLLIAVIYYLFEKFKAKKNNPTETSSTNNNNLGEEEEEGFEGNCCKVVMTTHFKDYIMSNKVLEDEQVKEMMNNVKLTEMESMLRGTNKKEVCFMYKLNDETLSTLEEFGVVPEPEEGTFKNLGSFGIEVAGMSGIPQVIVERAKEVKNCCKNNKLITPLGKQQRITISGAGMGKDYYYYDDEDEDEDDEEEKEKEKDEEEDEEKKKKKKKKPREEQACQWLEQLNLEEFILKLKNPNLIF